MPGSFTYNTLSANTPKGSAFQTLPVTFTPSGVIRLFAGSVVPNGWLACDGSAVSRRIYSDLFKVIGTTYGTGDSNTTFSLPDMRGRSPICAGAGVSLTARTLGTNAGAESVTLSIANLPSHTHTTTVSNQSPSHTHTGTSGTVSADHVHGYGRPLGSSGSYGIRDGAGRSANGTPNSQGATVGHTHSITTGTESSNHSHTVTNANTGSGSALGIMPPTLVVNFIIKI